MMKVIVTILPVLLTHLLLNLNCRCLHKQISIGKMTFDGISVRDCDKIMPSEEQDQTGIMCWLILLYTPREIIEWSRKVL